MKRGLRGSRFTYSLDKTLLQTYAKFLERMYKYIRMDKGASDWRQIEKKDQKKKQKKSEVLTEQNQSTINKRALPRQWSPRLNNYDRCNSSTPLSALHI